MIEAGSFQKGGTLDTNQTLPQILSITADDWGDQKRVRVYIDLSDISAHPNLEIFMLTGNEELSAHTHIIEAINPRIVITQHLRVLDANNRYRLRVTVALADQQPHEQKEIDIQL